MSIKSAPNTIHYRSKNQDHVGKKFHVSQKYTWLCFDSTIVAAVQTNPEDQVILFAHLQVGIFWAVVTKVQFTLIWFSRWHTRVSYTTYITESVCVPLFMRKRNDSGELVWWRHSPLIAAQQHATISSAPFVDLLPSNIFALIELEWASNHYPS